MRRAAKVTSQMSKQRITQGFTYPERAERRSRTIDAGLHAASALGLILSIAVTVTVVSMGIAQADTFASAAQSDAGRHALFALLGIAMAGMGGLTIAMVRASARARRYR